MEPGLSYHPPARWFGRSEAPPYASSFPGLDHPQKPKTSAIHHQLAHATDTACDPQPQLMPTSPKMRFFSQLFEACQIHWPFVLISVIFLYLASNRYQKGLHKIPGPWFNSVSTLPRMWSIFWGQHHVDDLRLHAMYGKYVRLAPNLVSVSDPSEINQIYGITTKFFKSPFYELAAVYDGEGLVPDPFVIQDNKALHSRMKRNAANAYSMNGLLKFEPWVDEVTDRFMAILHPYSLSGAKCDLGDLLKRFAMDAVCRLTFGRDLAYLEEGDRYNFFRTIDLGTAYMAIVGHVPWLHRYLLGNSWIAARVFGDDSSTYAMMQLAEQELDHSRSNPPSEDAIMTFLGRLSLNQISKPEQINDREIITHAFGNISAGSDTTAIAMRSVFYNVLSNPRVYDRLVSDVRRNLSTPVRFSAANDLAYLRAVIQESLRLHPSVGQILYRSVPKTGAVVGGYQLKAGAQLGISPWVLHRDPEVFAEPEIFRPERWLEDEGTDDKDLLRRMNQSFFTFGHGTHTCSGKHISIMEMTKLTATVLLEYDLELADGGKSYTFVNQWFTPQKDLYVHISPRK